MQTFEYKEEESKRIDTYLIEKLNLSRNKIQTMIQEQKILVNDNPIKNSYLLKPNDIISAEDYVEEEMKATPEEMDLDIVYEDDDIIVVNKANGIVVHPAVGNKSGTLVNGLLYHSKLSDINGEFRPGIVHRIDKDTSGLLMIAKNNKAHESLSRQLAEHTITRKYTALVYNNFSEEEGTVDAPLGRDPKNRLRRAVTRENSKRAVTHWRVLERFGKYTLIEAQLETGRTHQIRVHMAYINHPLVGDMLYGPKKQTLFQDGQLLHAGVLGFVHPSTGEYMEFSRPLPEEFQQVIERLRRS